MTGAARWASVVGTAALVGFVMGPLMAHFWVVAPMTGFVLFGLGGLLGVIGLVVGIVAIARGAGRAAIPGLVLGILVAGGFLSIALPVGRFPRINDITTDTTHPPQFAKAGTLEGNEGRDMTYPGESFAAQQRAGYPDLAPLRLDMAVDDAFKRVETAARSVRNWEITRVDSTQHALEGVATSGFFRFKDDFVIQLEPQDGGTLVQMRSKSRDGQGDVGANAARIKAFFAKLK